MLLVTLDTTRADILGCYEGEEGTTPHLDRLAADGVLYEAAHTVSPVTVPSHTSMLTGLYPLRHSVRSNDMHGLPQKARTVAEIAREHGVQTGAVIAAVALDSRFALNQGFDTYLEPKTRSAPGAQITRQFGAERIVDESIDWLESRDASRPFFLWVHLFDPHQPYTPPPDFQEGRFAGNPYLGEVGYLDRELGRLVDHLDGSGLLESTTVVLIGDHGEALGDHDEDTHGLLCYEPTMRVPMIVRYPDGYRRGERSTEIVSVVDVFPTVAESLGLPVPDDIDGISLYRRTVPDERGIYFEAYEGYLAFGYSHSAGWMDRRGKYVHSSRPLLFDLEEDPGELVDLAPQRADLVEEYKRKIGELAKKDAFTPISGAEIDEKMLANLRKLGYAGIGSMDVEIPHPLAPSDRPAPATVMQLHRDTTRGMDLHFQGQQAEAEVLLERAAGALPHSTSALYYLGLCRMAQNKYAAAIAPFQSLVQERPEMSGAHFNLGRCLLQVGQREAAVISLKEAVRLEPTQVAYYAVLVPLLARMGRLDEAAEYDGRADALGIKD